LISPSENPEKNVLHLSEHCPIITTEQKHEWGNGSLNTYKETPAKKEILIVFFKLKHTKLGNASRTINKLKPQ
jgi:hypothetical protein